MANICGIDINPNKLDGATFANATFGNVADVLTITETTPKEIKWLPIPPAEPATKLATTDANAPVVLTKNIPSVAQVLTALSATSAEWQTPAGVPTGNNQIAGWNGTTFGAIGTLDTDGLTKFNLSIGQNAKLAALGSPANNVAIGLNSLISLEPNIVPSKKPTNNLAIGTDVFTLLTGGNHNIGIGSNILSNYKTGSNNIVMGKNVLQLSTSGSNNIMLGNSANNVTQASFNIILGSDNINNYTNVISNNIVIGNSSGSDIIANNIIIGFASQSGVGNIQNSIVIGNGSTGVDNSISIGNNATATSDAPLALGTGMKQGGIMPTKTTDSDESLAIVIAGFPNAKGYYIPLYAIPP